MEKVNIIKWEKPVITEKGNAKDVVLSSNVVGGGDAVYSVLLPS